MRCYNELVTIVVPAFNAEAYLKENITSILGQTYKNLEVIYICDGCTDRTADILMKYTTDKRLKVCVELKNHGAAVSRNIGMNMAQGDWIIFLDADDLFEATMIEEMVECANKHCADMCCCYYDTFCKIPNAEAEIVNQTRKWFCKTYPIIETKNELYHIMQLVDKGPCTKLVHKSIYKKRNVFFQDIPNSNDVYYSMVAAMESKRIVYIDKAFLHYRSDEGRKTLSTVRNLKKPYILEAYNKIFEYIDSKESKTKLLQSFYNDVCSSVLFYMDKPVSDFIINDLKNTFLTKWGMSEEEKINNELSLVNRQVYKAILNKDMSIDKKNLVLSAKMEFMKKISKEEKSVWGTGLLGCELLEKISQEGILIQHVYDSAKEKIGKKVFGYLIEDFKDSQIQKNIIVTTPKFYEEIKEVIGDKAENVYNLEQEIKSIPQFDLD